MTQCFFGACERISTVHMLSLGLAVIIGLHSVSTEQQIVLT